MKSQSILTVQCEPMVHVTRSLLLMVFNELYVIDFVKCLSCLHLSCSWYIDGLP